MLSVTIAIEFSLDDELGCVQLSVREKVVVPIKDLANMFDTRIPQRGGRGALDERCMTSTARYGMDQT